MNTTTMIPCKHISGREMTIIAQVWYINIVLGLSENGYWWASDRATFFNKAKVIPIKTLTPVQACGISTELLVKSSFGDFFYNPVWLNYLHHFSLQRVAFAGNDLSDWDFMDKLLNHGSGAGDTEDLCQEMKQVRDERQQENFQKLQATVEAQGKLLQAMAEKLKITV